MKHTFLADWEGPPIIEREWYRPDPHQVTATEHLLKHRFAGLFMEMGLGKTAAALTALVEQLRRGEVRRTLVISTLSVARDVWSNEVDKWEHTAHLKVSKILGTAQERRQAVKAKADIYTINAENVPWLVSEYGPGWKWDYVILDESSLFKSAKSMRFKALRMVRPKWQRCTLLTGTPRPNSLMDLWSQLYLLDGGERLGKTLGEYRAAYFVVDKQKGHVVYSYKVRKDAHELIGEEIYAEVIYDKISDICISMKTEDYIKLPERIVRDVAITMDPADFKKYRAFEKELIMEMADKEVTAANAAVLTGKLLQFANGAIYDDEKSWHRLHDSKLNALADIIEEADGAPVLVLYQYKHDLERIKARFAKLNPVPVKDNQDAWNRGKLKLAYGHPKSMSHGLNLQAGGHIIVWFGLNWSLELYDQANARLHRRGQPMPVIIHRLLCKGTMDEDVVSSLSRKHTGQSGAMRALNARRKYYGVAA